MIVCFCWQLELVLCAPFALGKIVPVSWAGVTRSTDPSIYEALINTNLGYTIFCYGKFICNEWCLAAWLLPETLPCSESKLLLGLLVPS